MTSYILNLDEIVGVEGITLSSFHVENLWEEPWASPNLAFFQFVETLLNKAIFIGREV